MSGAWTDRDLDELFDFSSGKSIKPGGGRPIVTLKMDRSIAFSRAAPCSLSTEQQQTAIVAHSMMGGDLPADRRHFADNLHLGGAFQDNRIVPYEGLRGSTLSAQQRRDLLDLVAAYVAPLPKGPLAARLDEAERHLADTHFCWIGGFGEASPLYYRIQSPAVFIEFDHHAGVFLTNAEPAKFHVHTIVRTPNGNDYGIDLLRLHYQHAPHHRHAPKSPP